MNNHLPPQAYTREDVAKAYVWVQSQPDYVKNMATSKETLVALYLQARRNGIASLENIAPVSSRDFKTQLQSLASELNQFEKPKETLTATAPLNPPTSQPVMQEYEAPIINSGFDFAIPEKSSDKIRYDERSIELKVSERRSADVGLDSRSQQIVNHVKSALNIESDQEVIRMLITLGYEKLRLVFPQK